MPLLDNVGGGTTYPTAVDYYMAMTGNSAEQFYNLPEDGIQGWIDAWNIWKDANGQTTPPVTTPPVTTPPVQGGTNVPTSDSEAFGPFTQYLARLGIGATGGGPAAGYQRKLYDPLRTLYGLEQTFAPVTKATPGLWNNYLEGNTYAGNPSLIYGRAGDILSQLYGAGQAQRESLGASFSPEFEGESAVRAVPRETQQALLYQALVPKLGYLGSQRVANRLGTEEDIWLAQQGAAAGATTSQPTSGFFDYLVNKYGLSRFF